MKTTKYISFCLGLIAALALIGLGSHRWFYPYGVRTCCMPCTLTALLIYARDNGGWYPKDGDSPLQSLQKLNPGYIGDSSLLAGVSGDRNEVLKRLHRGQPIGETCSSWVYFPDFRDDDTSVAVIWESKGGICFNGARADGYTVGFADGHHEQISSGRWPAFVKDQEALRKAVLEKHLAGSTSSPPN